MWCQVQDFIALIGTQEGAIFKCSTARGYHHLLQYEGHSMSVYSVRWNPCQPATFLSCSADWTVKLWRAEDVQASLLPLLANSGSCGRTLGRGLGRCTDLV